MASTIQGRTTYRFRKLSRLLRAERRDCCLCHQAIDYEAPPRTRDAFSVQHILSWRDHPELREVYSNLDAAHHGCNSAEDHSPDADGVGLGGDPEEQW